MKPIEFPGHNIVLAKSQAPLLPLPVHVDSSSYGIATSCWELSWKDRLKVLIGGKVWVQIVTYTNRLQPQKLTVEKPELR